MKRNFGICRHYKPKQNKLDKYLFVSKLKVKFLQYYRLKHIRKSKRKEED